MSDYYFNKASEHCLGLHKGMAGFHECARKNNCMKPLDLKIRRAQKAIKPPKAEKPKKPKKPKKSGISTEDEQGLLDKFNIVDGNVDGNVDGQRRLW